MGDTIKVYSSNYDAKKLIMINPLYDNVTEYTDPSTNIVYPADVSRNYVNFTGDISNNDRLTVELSHYNENTLENYIAGAKKNYLDLSLNHDLHSLLLWGQYKLDNYPTVEYEKDLEIPVITLLGDTEISLFVNDNYVEPGYSALDNIDGVITNKVVVTGSVNTSLEGIYDISYDVTDTLGNQAITVGRKVTVTIDLTIPIYKLDNIFADGSTGPTYPITTNAISSWNGFIPDKDWSIKMSVHKNESDTLSHTTLWKFAYANGYASLRRFDQWGLVFSWVSDAVTMSGANPENNQITIGYKNDKTSRSKYFDFAIAYNSVNYSHDSGGTTPDIEDIAFFIKEEGGSWVEIPKSAAQSHTIDTMFLYYHGDDLDESHDFTWSSSENMTAEFGGEHHTLPAISSSNNITMSGLNLWNMSVTVSELTDN